MKSQHKANKGAVGKVTGADIRSPTKIAPGTRASAEGIGEITAVRIGGGKDE